MCFLKFKICKNGLIDVYGDVKITNTNRQKLPLKFGKVTGDFHCSSNLLTTLKNSPYHVGGSFNCKNNKLKSLKYGPKYVGGDFYASGNILNNLNGCPDKIGGKLTICSSLKSIDLGGKNCILKSVTIVKDDNHPFRIPKVIYLNQNHLVNFFKYNNCLELYDDAGTFNEDNFCDFLIDLIEGFE